MTAPRENPEFIGHQAAVAALHSAAVSGRLHHAWLIGGQVGIGKATMAYRFARWLLAGATNSDLSVPTSHPAFKRIAANTHTDLLTIERRFDDKRKKMQSEIVVDTVLEVGKFLRLTPGEGGWRVVIVDGAEEMNRNAANALLKLLEEPPQRAILLLVSHAPGRLLPTIRSRCRTLNLSPLAENDVISLLNEHAPELSSVDAARIARLSEGSIGTALELAAEDGVAIAGLVDEALAAPVPPARAQSIADAISRSEDGYEVFMALLRSGLAASTRQAARQNQPALGRAVTLWEGFGKLERDVQNLNLDKRAAIIVALSQLHGS
ncbi:MAG: DNA polymerase III subunit delta' [Acidocella sp. 20-57-95]|nr:MAG: DNA polymerase III subunit delta' [Acidocella sp. 20-57-95]OYV58173.1 MAG: DNA polymerase III subunit delta' [Acidocella sp. 21-58-7]HQT64496.1 DNA polymerase III subunit delta' [Acidocella sp.]HQU04980.1 DNA polymerase III subunit delta' [Acidocella sp.]